MLEVFRRFRQYFALLFGKGGPDDALLARERAVLRITQRNHLQEMQKATHRRIRVLEKCADLAEATGDTNEARRLRGEIVECEESLARTQAAFQEAADTVEEVKRAIRDEEERIRRKTADALFALEAWKRGQMPPRPPDSLSPPDSLRFIAAALLLVLVACCLLRLSWYR